MKAVAPGSVGDHTAGVRCQAQAVTVDREKRVLNRAARGRFAGATVVAILVVASGCSTGPRHATTGDHHVVISAQAQKARADASRLFFSWYGTKDDRSAAEAIVAYGLNGALAECMKDEGFPTDWRLSIMNAATVDALGPAIWTNEPMGRTFSDPYLAAADFMRHERVMNDPPETEGRAEASLACQQSVSAGITDHQIDGLRQPRGRQSLFEAWRRDLRAATSDLGSLADYDDCLAAQSVPLLGGQPPTKEDFDAAIRDYTPTADDLPDANDPEGSPAWRQFLALESQWLDADWACRADTYEEAMSRVPAFAEQFAREHSDQITRLRSAWALTRRQARAIGWDETFS